MVMASATLSTTTTQNMTPGLKVSRRRRPSSLCLCVVPNIMAWLFMRKLEVAFPRNNIHLGGMYRCLACLVPSSRIRTPSPATIGLWDLLVFRLTLEKSGNCPAVTLAAVGKCTAPSPLSCSGFSSCAAVGCRCCDVVSSLLPLIGVLLFSLLRGWSWMDLALHHLPCCLWARN